LTVAMWTGQMAPLAVLLRTTLCQMSGMSPRVGRSPFTLTCHGHAVRRG